MKAFARLVFDYNSLDMYKMLIYESVTYNINLRRK